MIDATVAQSVEQFTRNEQVAGSNPAGSSNFIMNICRCVGTGRRDGLKIRCQRWRVGSSPTTGTKNPVHVSGRDFYLLLITYYIFTLTSTKVFYGIFGK